MIGGEASVDANVWGWAVALTYVEGSTSVVAGATAGVGLLGFGASAGRLLLTTSSRGSLGVDTGNVPGMTGSSVPTLALLSASFSGSDVSACPGVVPNM